jgi:hypothetical protein
LQQTLPGGLGVVEHEGDELHLLVLFGRARDGPGGARGAGRTVTAQQGEEVLLEDQAEDEQDGRAAESDPHAAPTEPAAAPAAILEIAAGPTRCPPHESSSC